MAAHNLPMYTNLFIGRAEELSQIAALLHVPTCRLLTLTGPGGIGKTRLAIEAARLMLDANEERPPSQTSAFSAGGCFVPLQPLTSPDFIVPAVANALRFTFQGELDSKQQLFSYLREKHLLLVLDNFEHLAEGADLLPEMLETASNLKVLVTSRERLRLREEWVFDVGGLTFPEVAQIAGWDDFTAVQFFLQSARRAGYTPTDADTASIVRICEMVEGIPLAVELAAAWVRVMSCADIAREVQRSLDILATTTRNMPEKHRSMRAAFERSWESLTGDEQAAFRKLSVFRGGFTREGAEQVAGATLGILASLVDKSLVQVDSSRRYNLHELLRQYAADKLQDVGEADTTIQTHCDYFLWLAEETEAHNFGREQIAWFDRLEADMDNLRAVLAWSAETETGLRLAVASLWFLNERTHWREGLEWMEQTLAANPDAPDSLRAKALHSVGALAFQAGYFRQARAYLEQALALARAANDRWNIAWSLSWLGLVVLQGNAFDQSAAVLDESLALFRELEDPMGITHTLIRRSWDAGGQGDYPYTHLLLEEAGMLAREAGDKITAGWTFLGLGRLAQLGHLDRRQAKSYYENSLSSFREARFPNGYIRSLIWLAETEQAMGNWARTQELMEEIRILLREIAPDKAFLRLVLAILAVAARHRGQFERAATLIGASLSPDLTGAIPPKDAGAESATALDSVIRAQLGEIVFAKAWAAGNAMTREQAFAFALEGETTPNQQDETSDTASQARDSLNTREFEVLSLVARGLSNREIAGELFLSVNTVKWYLKEIFAKLDVTNRAQAVARSQTLGLLSQE
jgi:predicted ATPase/DNA-binding CsgD family transcriptional regulator